MNQPLVEIVSKRLQHKEVSLPVFDNIALKINKEVNEGTMDSDELSRIIEKDPVIVAEIIRMSNSSFFAGLNEITTLEQAVVRMGVKQIASLVMSSSQKRLYSSSNSSFRSELIRLWEHAFAVGSASRWIAINTGNRAIAEEAFISGMLHDIGKLHLLMVIEDVMNTEPVEFTSSDLYALLDDMHLAQGLAMLNEWNMPQIYKDVVENADSAVYENTNLVVRIVRLADRLCTEQGMGYGVNNELTDEQWNSLAVPEWCDEKKEKLVSIFNDLK